MKQSRFNSIIGKEGHYFNVMFEKADGSRRKMLCRKGVKKHLVGASGKGKPIVEDLENVWEKGEFKAKEAYRSFYCSKIISLKANGHVYDAEGKQVA